MFIINIIIIKITTIFHRRIIPLLFVEQITRVVRAVLVPTAPAVAKVAFAVMDRYIAGLAAFRTARPTPNVANTQSRQIRSASQHVLQQVWLLRDDESLFKEITATKDYNPSLKVFISVGGWTFSDNGTVTQPLLSEISSSDSNRRKFADNVVKFCNKWGFDGLDLDWEYPGAPDRGGKPVDTENFTTLMKALRQAFNGSPRALELSFTIPSSYWYLKWFDMPGLLKYADWANLMSYDLHGVWDRNNPIGSGSYEPDRDQVSRRAAVAHRSETRTSCPRLRLLWTRFRSSRRWLFNIRLFFQGRCPRRAVLKESGVLMHYEIKAILNQAPNLKPIWDKEAAVKYLVFDNNQWVPYDDKDTFGQKIDWANSVGFGGALIWASDTDDDKFSAMSGFLGKEVAHIDVKSTALEVNAVTIARTQNALSGKGCSLYKEGGCRSQSDFDNNHVRCPNGNPPIGYDKDGCKMIAQVANPIPICCNGNIYPTKCTWRGGGGDCNGQCHPGEQKIHGSSWGGGFKAESGVKKCSRGGKAFCCEVSDWKNLVQGCYWTNCGSPCPVGKKSMLASKDCTALRQKHYCCSTNTLLNTCSWGGSLPDCLVANCEKDEVNVVLDEIGDKVLACAWGRHISGCCKVSDPPPRKLQCTKTTCEINERLCSDTIDDYGVLVPVSDSQSLEKRGPKGYKWTTLNSVQMLAIVLPYLRGVTYMQLLSRGLRGLHERYFRMEGTYCPERTVRSVPIVPPGRPPNAEIGHAVLLMLTSRFLAVANHGRTWTQRPVSSANRIPIGPATRTPAMTDEGFWQNVWDNPTALSANVERLTETSPQIRRPSELFAEGFGSNANPYNFVFLERAINRAKGRIEGFNRNMGVENLRQSLNQAVSGDESAASRMIESFAESHAVFTYLNHADIMTRVDNTINDVRRALRIIENEIPAARGLVTHWDEFYPTYMAQVFRPCAFDADNPNTDNPKKARGEHQPFCPEGTF
ncbi:hypothetical protein GQ44DRAFT_831181 [Phaeosphaeriaceae sp. PMI808]|nr:hypothetical protein GQ44DRAFT_831181 [Phaeosphaeriaceae sp. PMI808]